MKATILIQPDDVRVEHIDLNGKQLLVVTGLTKSELEELGDGIKEWLKGPDPILMIHLNSGAEVKLEKVC